MSYNNSERYVCRFCAAAGASGENATKLFYNCHVCKAPNAMVPVTMHNELIRLVVQNDFLMAKQHQVYMALDGANSKSLQVIRMRIRNALDALKDQSAFQPDFQAVRTEPDPEPTVTEEPQHFRTWLNRLIDKCPEAVQNHVWELREQANKECPDVDSEFFTKEEVIKAYKEGYELRDRQIKELLDCGIRDQGLRLKSSSDRFVDELLKNKGKER